MVDRTMYFRVSGKGRPTRDNTGRKVAAMVWATPRYSVASVLISAVLLIGCGGGTAASKSGAGNLAALSASPSTIDFGNVTIGNSSTQTGTLTAGTSSVTISTASWNGQGYSVTGVSLPVTLTAGQSQTFSVSFTPQISGAASGQITVTSTASNPALNIPLSGTGVTPGFLTASPSSVNFGSIQVGSSQAQYETLTNSGSSSLTISQATVTGTGFGLSGITVPQTLAAGQSITFSVSFAPRSNGAASGALTLASNASNAGLSVSLSGTGTGVQPVQHSVDLSWGPSPSSVIGYYVYRGTKSGGPYPLKLNSSPQPGTSFVDDTVLSGTTYYYVVTSLNANSVESSYSNEVTVVIP